MFFLKAQSAIKQEKEQAEKAREEAEMKKKDLDRKIEEQIKKMEELSVLCEETAEAKKLSVSFNVVFFPYFHGSIFSYLDM